MYWTHLIFVFLHGGLFNWQRTAASKPGYLDFDNLPETNFSCDGKVIGGYYADVETGCQMFHVCTIGQKGEVTDIKFLCLNGTVFDQETRVCERIDEVDCSKSEDFFGLNLELYGNNANFGIQPENEFECEDCSTDQTEDDEYEESEETTTYTTSTTTTTTTTTTPKPTTSSTTTARPTHHYQTSSQETIAALLALHNAFNQGLQGSKVKAPPPRVINNAFSPTKPTIKPYSTYATQRPNANLNFKSHYTPDSQSYGSLNLQQRERPYYFTPATEKSNYHHFHSGDTSFGHSFDVTRPYNFQYFHSRKIPDDKPSVSVVTSTSTSTSIKTSKPNATDATEYPTGFDDYQDDIQDSFFDDVPKLRQKRDYHWNHKSDEEVTTIRYKNHKYDDETDTRSGKDREQFLQNLLGSIDLEDNVREKMTDFFKKEEQELDSMSKNGGFEMNNLGNKIGQIFLQEINITDSDERKTKSDKLTEWRKYFDDMKRDINLNYTFETNLKETDNNKLDRVKRDTRRIGIGRATNPPSRFEERGQSRRTNIDTEQFQVETKRVRPGKEHVELKPVSEDIHDDFTTLEYRRSSKVRSHQPRSTTSLRDFKFNYETTSALPDSLVKPLRQSRRRPLPSKEARDFVHEENDYPETSIRHRPQEIRAKTSRSENENPLTSNGARDFRRKENNNPETSLRHRPQEIRSKNSRTVNENPLPSYSARDFVHKENNRPAISQRHRPQETRSKNPRTQEIRPETENPLPPNSARDFVLKEDEFPETSQRHPSQDVRLMNTRKQTENPFLPKESKELINEELRSTTPVDSELNSFEKEQLGPPQSQTASSISEEEKDFIHEERPAPVLQTQRPREAAPNHGRASTPSPLSSREDRKEGYGRTTSPLASRPNRGRGRVRSRSESSTPTSTTTLIPRVTLIPDPNFDCEGKVKGGFYADIYNDCRAFFICSQGEINGPLLKTHFPCGDKTKFNQRSRTCQAEDLVECSVSKRYFHLNNDFLVPESEDDLKGNFEPLKVR